MEEKKSSVRVAGAVFGSLIHSGAMGWACAVLWGNLAFWPLAAISAGQLAVTFAKAVR